MLLYTAKIEIRECVKWSLQEVKNKRKSYTFRPKNVVGRGRLQKVVVY